MTYTIIFILALFVLIIALLLFIQRQNVKSEKNFSSTVVPKGTATSMPADSTTSGQLPSAMSKAQQWSLDSANAGGLTNNGATRTPEKTRITGSKQKASPVYKSTPPGYSGSSTYPPSLQEFSPLSTPKLTHTQSRSELEQEYERGMRTIYDEKVGAVNFISIHVVMNTPAEVELAFRVCKRQIRTVLQAKGLNRAPTLTDIGGLVIGRDATAAWGQALKNYLEEMCIKAGKDTYLLAHYNSQADRPNQDQLQEKIKLIQFMTSASINNFQSNIFDTREEAVAFLQRMREVYQV